MIDPAMKALLIEGISEANSAMLTLLDQLPPQNTQQRLATVAAEGLTPEQVRAAISSLAANLILLLLPERESLRVLGGLSG